MSKPKTFTELEQQIEALALTLSDIRAERNELRAKVRYLEQQHEKLTAEAKAARAAAKKAQASNSHLRDVNEDLKASRAQCRALQVRLARVIRAATSQTTSEDTTEE